MDVKVPDIGDFKDVPVIEVLVKPGDKVEKEQPLVTLESDKATMDVPSPAAGTVSQVRVKVGDKVSEGSVILTLEAAESAGAVIANRQRFTASGKPQLSLNRRLPRFWLPERKPHLLKRRDDGRQRGGADVRPFPDLFAREPH